RHSKIKTIVLIIDVIKSSLIEAVSGVFIFFSLSIACLVSQTLCFMIVLAACSYRYGLIPSIISSFVGLFLYIYLYLEPNFVF
ncbi:hypothetical protein NAI72_10635, partial [Francisella tularensis subsp. holarctica]|uniref:hypothetical protein n=1 Tax=Francisella tularensis TaxID=263 RepID=UPI002381B29E